MKGDIFHPTNDPEWDSPVMRAYLYVRPWALPDEERDRRKARRNQKYYRKKKRQYDAVVRQTAGLSAEEKAERLRPFALGWYRTRTTQKQLEDMKIDLNSKLREAEQRLRDAQVGGNVQDEDAANRDVEEVQRQLKELSEENETLINDYQHITSQLALLYRTSPTDLTSRIRLTWPTTPSVEAYFDLILLLTPIQHLIELKHSLHETVQRAMKVIVHPDSRILADKLSREQKTSLSQVLNSSLESLRRPISRSEEAKLNKQWETRKTSYIYNLALVSSQVPGFVFQELIDFALASNIALNAASSSIIEGSAILDFNNLETTNEEVDN